MESIKYFEQRACVGNHGVASVAEGRTRLRQPLVVAMSFRLRDMGNGVDRIENGVRIPFDVAVAGADRAGCEPLPQPTPARIKDAVVQMLGALSITAQCTSELLVEGYVQAAADRAVDVVTWMALLV